MKPTNLMQNGVYHMYKQLSWQLLRAGIVLGVLILCYAAGKILLTYAYPFMLAFFLAFLLHPVVSFIQRWLKLPRALATMLAMAGFVAASVAVMMTIFAEITQGMFFLADRLPFYFETGMSLFKEFIASRLIPLYERFLALFDRLDPTQQDTIAQYLQNASAHAASYGATLLQQFFLKLAGFTVVLPSSISVTIFTVLATFFITNDYESLMKHIKRCFPSNMHKHAKSLSSHFKKGMIGYAKAQFMLVMISTIIIFTGLLLLRIDHALTITLLAAFADLLPLFGTGIVFIPWIIYLLVTEKLTLAVILALLYLFVILTRQIMEPKVLSSSLGISPLLSLTVLFAAIKLYGFMGLLMTPLLLILLTGVIQAQIPRMVFGFIKGDSTLD